MGWGNGPIGEEFGRLEERFGISGVGLGKVDGVCGSEEGGGRTFEGGFGVEGGEFLEGGVEVILARKGLGFARRGREILVGVGPGLKGFKAS